MKPSFRMVCAAAALNIVLSAIISFGTDRRLKTAFDKYTEAGGIMDSLYTLPSINRAVSSMESLLYKNTEDGDVGPFLNTGEIILELFRKFNIKVSSYNLTEKELIFTAVSTADRIIRIVHEVSFMDGPYSVGYLKLEARNSRCILNLMMEKRDE